MNRRMNRHMSDDTLMTAVVALGIAISLFCAPRVDAALPLYVIGSDVYEDYCVDPPDVDDLRNHPDFQEITDFVGDSVKNLPGQCRTGRMEILYKLDKLRIDKPYLFDEIDYGPVWINDPRYPSSWHHAVVLYIKGPPRESPEDAAKRGVIFEYTNFWSDWTGDYRKTRSWCDFTRNGAMGGDVKDLRAESGFPIGLKDLPYFGNYPTTPVVPDEGPLAKDPATCLPPKDVVSKKIAVVAAHDPNEKAGSPGVTEARYISGEEPLRYAVFFENVETATAAAQEVVITDQLDLATMDLATVSLGAIGFGSRHVIPPAGLDEFTTDVDLRPDKELLVRIDARLDAGTGVLTWRFTSLDPATGLPPDDPTAGFLPPNQTAPEGEGSVVFTVKPKADLATGTEIRNRATIVFDVNPPIDTPEWLNTLDYGKPASQATAQAAACSTAIDVSWSGSDAGSGIQDYTVWPSEDGGAPTLWVFDTAATSGTFVGRWGKTYGFYSVARDRTGNVEDTPATPQAVVTLTDCGGHDLAVTKIAAKRRVALRDPVTRPIAVEIQNRSVHDVNIADLTTLANLVTLDVESLGSCPAPLAVPRFGRVLRRSPRVIKPNRKLRFFFDVTFDCANDPAAQTARDPGHGDYHLSARVDHAPLGGTDAHSEDDVCPRSVTPPWVIDPFPHGKIRDKGCGTKKPDATFGDPVVIDIVVGG